MNEWLTLSRELEDPITLRMDGVYLRTISTFQWDFD